MSLRTQQKPHMLRVAYAAFATGALVAVVVTQVFTQVCTSATPPLPASQFWARFVAHAGRDWSNVHTLAAGDYDLAVSLAGNLSVAAAAAAVEEAVVMFFPVLDRNGNGKLEPSERRLLSDAWARLNGQPRRRPRGTWRQQDVLAYVRQLATAAKVALQQWSQSPPLSISTTRYDHV